jgi:hypothetical protein
VPWKPRLVSALVGLAFSTPFAAFATVNHGDFVGTGVDFLAVSETTTTGGDPEPIWGAPTLAGTGTQLVFAPASFLSSCSLGSSDVTESQLTTTIEAQPGVHIEIVALQENGDAVLSIFPPFGTPATNVSAAITGTVTVLEDISGPIAPVVIPFSGTFTPSGAFALPTDFGTRTWTGDILVDVASVVPNATVVEFALTNTLSSNCGPGNSAATIQKKDVSGPAVALMVNPLECELEIDKTCCVTQPVLPDLDVCEGDVIRLVLEYTGDKCHASSNDQGHAFHCWGHRKLGDDAEITILSNASQITATPATDLDVGETVEFTSSTGTLFDKLKFKVRDGLHRRQILKIDTSCDRALQCGDQFGAFEVVEIETTEGGLVDCSAPPPPPVCALPGDPVGTPCDGKLVDMVLEYNGQDCQVPLPNPQNGEAECEGDATGATNVGVIYTGSFPNRQTISPASGINDGDRIRVTATFWGGLFPNQKFKIVDGGGVRQNIEFHVSCSQPLALGDEFGSFKLVEFTTKEGTHVALPVGDPGPFDACEVPLAPPGPHCTDQLDDITLVYIGDFLGLGCTVSNPQGGWASCTGVADPGDPVSITAPPGLDVDPVDLIEFGDLVTIANSSGWPLSTFTSFAVTGAGGSQNITIKTSCHKPLSLGDRFGSFVVFGMNRRDDGPISLGGNVQYQYTVTNPNASTVDNVEVIDDQLGVIASGESIGPGGVETFVRNATLFGTTTNVATVTGDVGGDICDPGTDTLTVNVLAPPPGAFCCSEPIKELTLKWGGAQTVLVKAWKGAPFASPLLAQFDAVAPGDAVSVHGFGSSYPIYEIFNASGTVKLGESTFDLWCDDKEMNGVEDCGKNLGNTKYNHANKINDWLLEGMVDSNETLACTPGLVPNPPDCGIGPELFVLMPGLMWLHRRRLRKLA